jgi:hypothetical protein
MTFGWVSFGDRPGILGCTCCFQGGVALGLSVVLLRVGPSCNFRSCVLHLCGREKLLRVLLLACDPNSVLVDGGYK